jgi:hypothetical protein
MAVTLVVRFLIVKLLDRQLSAGESLDHLRWERICSQARNTMSNKPHHHPHGEEEERRPSLIKRLVVGVVILAVFLLLLRLSASGVILFGRR